MTRWTVKLIAVSAFVWGAAWLTGCCCCGPGIPDTGGEFIVQAEGRSTLPDVGQLKQASASPGAQRY